MLLNWAKHNGPSDDDTPGSAVKFARWLISADPDCWHIVAANWNRDDDEAPILWIIRQKSCDIATALEIFFSSAPESYFRYGSDRTSVPAGWEREGYDLLVEIRQRLAEGFYTRSELAYDGADRMAIFNRGVLTDEDQALAKIFMAPQAGSKISGRSLQGSDSPAIRKCYEMLDSVQ